MDNWVLDAVTKIICALIIGLGIGFIIVWIVKQLKSGYSQRPPQNDLPKEYPNEPKSEEPKKEKGEIDEYHI